jgi:hypothetical protein
MKRSRPLLILALIGAAASAACADGRRAHQTHSVRFDVGGSVAYAGPPSEPLIGVAVTLIDVEGNEFLATTGSHGLWTIEGVRPGVFFERFELAGYQALEREFSIEAFGENDVSNPFIARPPALLEETRLRGTVEPFGVSLSDGDELFDGVGGASIEYSLGDSEDVMVALNAATTEGALVLLDMISGDFVVAALDTATMTTITIAATQIEGMNGGTGLTPSPGPLDLHQLGVSVSGFTPIHGDPVNLEAAVWFRAVP